MPPLTVPSSIQRHRKQVGLAILCLIAILAGLFWRSILPDIVQFSNDGPLGVQVQDRGPLAQRFTGMWADTNSLGANGGTAPFSFSYLLRLVLGPVGHSKFFTPLGLLVLGLGMFYFLRQLRFAFPACLLGALAAMLNTWILSGASWGLASQTIAFGMDLTAMGLIVFSERQTSRLRRWFAVALAGFAVGINVIEAADIGAIFSILVATFIMVRSVVTMPVSVGRGFVVGGVKVAVVGGCAVFIAFQTVSALVGSQIQGIAGAEQDTQSKQERWNWATQWSQPKVETLAIIVPGLFGNRMDSAVPGNYWGMVGSDPAWDAYLAGGTQGEPPRGIQRFNGNNPYAGILVLIIAAWAVMQCAAGTGSVFSLAERRLVGFWTIVAVLALLLSWGRFAPFYQFVYALPYFSTIRNPTKYLYVFNVVTTILFAYGIHGLWQKHVAVPAAFAGGLSARLNRWWTGLKGMDKRWAVGCVVVVGVALVGTFVYTNSRAGLEKYLAVVGFPGDLGKAIAGFSITQAWIFIGYLVVAVGLLFAVLSGMFSGRRSNGFAILVGLFLLVDLGRADLPFIKHVDYKHKYDLNVRNPVLEFFSQHPYEQRVAVLPFPVPEQLELLNQVYRIEWAQHHFPYHNIQSLDIIQMPRMPVDLMAYERAWSERGPAGLLRRWELTNTRYLLGPAPFAEGMNTQLDPAKKRFAVKLPFAIQPKPGIRQAAKLEDLTAVSSPSGPYGVIEFNGALPRAGLYSSWIINTNDAETLTQLFSPEFDPGRSVMVSGAVPAAGSNETNSSPGTVAFTSYTPSRLALRADAKTPAILLLNDRYDANWTVTVDGQPAPLLRCNYIMRGVYLAPGTHEVEFKFRLPIKALYVTLAAMGLGVILLLALVVTTRRARQPERESGA